MIMEIFVAIATIYILIWLVKRRILINHLQSKFASPQGLPIIGHSMTFKNPDTLIETSRQIHKDFGKTVFVQLGFDYYLSTIDPKFVEFICGHSACISKSSDYVFFKDWFGTGLLTASGDKWRSHRKILTPSFHYTILEEFVEVFNSSGEIFISKLKEIKVKENVNIYDYVTLFTLDIIHETAMGTSIDAQRNPNSLYVNAIREMCDVIYQRIFSPIGRFQPLYNFSNIRRREKNALKIIHEHSNSVIKNRRKMLSEEKHIVTQNDDDIGIKRKHTFLDVLIMSNINGKPLSNEEIREEVDTFMFEGHDTTAVAISFILYCIANHQDIQEKINLELQSIFGDDKERSVTYKEMLEMKYLDMVIREGLRLYPSVPSYSRSVTEDVMYDGILLPKGIMVSINPLMMHSDPDLYSNPEVFDPERFTLKNSCKRHPYAYVPFSAGSRNCIGQKFAMLEMKSSISKILRNFKLLPAKDGHKLMLGSKVTLFSKNGIKIKLTSR